MRADEFLDSTPGMRADEFLGPEPAAKPTSLLRRLGDVPISLAKGIVGAGEAAVGLADLASGGKAGKALNELTGYDPKATKQFFDEGYSAAQQEANRKVADAEGFGGTLGAMLENPSTIGHTVVESLPSTLGGAAFGRALLPKGGAIAKAMLGEGAIGAGSLAEGIRQETADQELTALQSGAAALGGIGTGLLGGLGGAIGRRLGVDDLDVALARGSLGTSTKGLPRRVVEGALSEGILEELPQSMQEQAWQNVALDKPLLEGVPEAGAQGMLAGIAMGGGFNAISGKPTPPPAPAPAPTNAEMDAANLELRGAADQYLEGGVAGLLPDRGIPMPPPPPDGTLAAAAHVAGQAPADLTSQLLRAYATPEDAQAELEQRPDAAFLSVVPHPRAQSGYAVVRKPAGEIAQIQQAQQEQAQAQQANQAAQVRQEQVAQEEEASARDQAAFKTVVELNRNAAALEKSIGESTPPAEAAAIRGQAAEMRAEAERIHQASKVERQSRAAPDPVAVNQAAVADAAQDEVAPAAVQPVATMPAAQVAAARRLEQEQAQAQQANQAAQARQEQVAQEEEASVDAAAAAANPTPTDKQKDAGNYAKGHISVGGLQIAVENPAGTSRSGVERGKKWVTKMKAHYGYVKRTKGADGDQVDVYVKPGTSTNHGGPVFVVDQYDPGTGSFDEHKVLVGYGSQAEAAKAYDAHFGDKTGPKRRGAVTQMTLPVFKQWLSKSDTTRPASSTKFGDQPAVEAEAAQEEIRASGGRLSTKRGDPDARLRQKAEESNARKKQRADAPELRTKAEHEATVNQLVGVRDASVVTEMPGADKAAAGEVSKQSADFIRQVARLFKKKVVFYRSASGKAADGAWRTDGDVIYLNVSSSVAQLRVLGHELVHAMRVQAPEAFEAMRKALANLLTDEQLAAQHKDYFGTELAQDLDKPAKGTNGQTLRDFLAEEWMADLAGNRFAEASFWSQVFSEIESAQGTEAAQGIVARLRMAISNAINQLLQVIKGNTFGADSRLEGQLEQVRAAVKDGFVAYAKAARAGSLLQQSEGRIGQVSWEAMPGKTSGVLPGIFGASQEEQAEYLAAIDKALQDEGGQDLIAQEIGLPVQGTAFGPSAWQMNVGAGAQTEVQIQVSDGALPAEVRERLNTYSAIRGYVLAQEAVVWHYPIFDAVVENANGVQLDFGRDPTHDEVAKLYQSIFEVSGRDDWAPAYVPGVGVRVLNFSDVPNPEFHAQIREAAARIGIDLRGRTFRSEGDYIGNDWEAHPDGAQYKEAIHAGNQLGPRGSERPDLQEWVESELRPRVERVNQDFADRYGWGKVRFSRRRRSEARRQAAPQVAAAPRQVQGLAVIFEGLDARGLKRIRANESLETHPRADQIRYVQENILDILDTLESSGVVAINC
ncbi:MAG: hypothetical protein PHI64_16890 [Zoogloea sp.]|uniref:hypothetical protein n=1 Tax=Zoogloea sp. TaxID=49181 RepID=UPI0026362B4D|nr:hypothetical protein [Zoogloea sp.]MDD2990620.1 hypothetical protein [Zoogloea sp.]